MNAFARDHSPVVAPVTAPVVAGAMARDLLGVEGSPSRPPFTLHKALSSLDGRGPLSLAEAVWPTGSAVPAHVHAAEDELLIVLAGEIELTLGDRTLRRGAGSSAFIPRGTSHAVRALSEARTMCVLTRQDLDAAA